MINQKEALGRKGLICPRNMQKRNNNNTYKKMIRAILSFSRFSSLLFFAMIYETHDDIFTQQGNKNGTSSSSLARRFLYIYNIYFIIIRI